MCFPLHSPHHCHLLSLLNRWPSGGLQEKPATLRLLGGKCWDVPSQKKWPVSECLDILNVNSGWWLTWYTYPSEKYERQLG